jgi:hypothetical protein
MFDVLILLAKIKKWFGQFGDLGGFFFSLRFSVPPQYFTLLGFNGLYYLGE